MALVLADRVLETSTTVGTTTFALGGATTGFQSFSSGVGDGNTTYYTIAFEAANEWEVGVGTYTLSGSTLSRDTILASSNSGSAVNFSAGTKNVFTTYPASKSVYEDASGNVSLPGAISATQVDVLATGDVRFQDTTGGEYVALQAPGTVSSSYTLTLPASDGTNGQGLTTDGAGNLSFSNTTGKAVAMVFILG